MADPDVRKKLAKEGRLWMLSLICAIAGAVAVYLSDRVGVGILVFLGCLALLGTALFGYERRQRK